MCMRCVITVSPGTYGRNMLCGVPPTSTSFSATATGSDPLVKDSADFYANVTNYDRFDGTEDNKIKFNVAVMALYGSDDETHKLSIAFNDEVLGDVTFTINGAATYPVCVVQYLFRYERATH